LGRSFGWLALYGSALTFWDQCDEALSLVKPWVAGENFLSLGVCLLLVAEERVAAFMAPGKETDFFERPTVRPNPQGAMIVLRDVRLQTILPVTCLPPAVAPSADPLTSVSQCLLRHSIVILS
jgi:hypothetical protein